MVTEGRHLFIEEPEKIQKEQPLNENLVNNVT